MRGHVPDQVSSRSEMHPWRACHNPPLEFYQPEKVGETVCAWELELLVGGCQGVKMPRVRGLKLEQEAQLAGTADGPCQSMAVLFGTPA